MYPYFDPQFAEYDYLYDMYLPHIVITRTCRRGVSRAGSISIVGVDTHPAGLATGRLGWSWIVFNDSWKISRWCMKGDNA